MTQYGKNLAQPYIDNKFKNLNVYTYIFAKIYNSVTNIIFRHKNM